MKVRTAVMCELCRPDLGNKWTLLGVFGGDLFVDTFPAQIPLSAYLEIEAVTPGAHTMSIKVDGPGIEMRIEGGFDANGEAGVVSVPLPNLQVAFEKPGELVITVGLDDGEPVEVARRGIYLGEQ